MANKSYNLSLWMVSMWFWFYDSEIQGYAGDNGSLEDEADSAFNAGIK